MSSVSDNIKMFHIQDGFRFKRIPFEYRYGDVYYERLDRLRHSKENAVDKISSNLKKILILSFGSIPYYKSVLMDIGVRSVSEIESYSNRELFSVYNSVPVLNRKDVSKNSKKFTSSYFKDEDLIEIKTSGSSGERLSVFINDSVYKREAAHITRSMELSGINPYDSPTIWLRRYNPKKTSDPLWYFDYELNRLYMSIYNISKDNFLDYCKRMEDTGSNSLISYPSGIFIFSELCEKTGYAPKWLEKAHFTSEKMNPIWMKKIKKVLPNLNISSHYGQIEKSSLMFTTSYGISNFKNDFDYGVASAERVSNSEYCKIVSTGFINPVMPLIKYDTGDRVLEKECLFLERSNIISQVSDIDGRDSDLLYNKIGQKVPCVNFYTMAYKIEGLDGFKITQYSDMINIELVCSKDFTKIRDEFKNGLISRLGDLNFVFSKVDFIDRDLKTGKTRSIICKI